MEQPATVNLQPLKLEGYNLAYVLHQIALEENNSDNIGRIILSEARRSTRTPNLNFEMIQQLWKQFFAHEDVDDPTANVVRVYFDGKETIRNRRRALTPINLQTAPTMAADKSNEFYSKPETYSDTEVLEDGDLIDEFENITEETASDW